MKNLILTCGKKVACVTGVVTRIDEKAETVTIQNTVSDTPISVTLLTKLKVIQNLKLREGAFIMAVVKPSNAIGIYADGGSCNEKEIIVKSYNIRYTGIFNMLDATVVCGNVVKVSDGISKRGNYWQRVSIEYKSMGKIDKANIFFNKKQDVTTGKRYVFACGNVTDDKDISGWAFNYLDMFN